MHSEARIAIVMVALALAAIPAWMAGRLMAANLRVLSHWRKVPATVVALAEANAVTLELGSEPDGSRIRVPVTHQLGLSFLKKVTAYVDPEDERNVRTGGLLQMWSWPAALAVAAIVMLACAAGGMRLGGGLPTSPDESHGRWMLSPPPAPMSTEIRVYRPASEGRAPLLWALLGVALVAVSVFAKDQSQASRTCTGAAGLLFVLLMAGLAWNNRSTEVSADATGLRKTTAFGWSQVRWEEVGSVTRERTVFGRSSSSLRTRNDSFPGREVTQIVFADRAGRRLMTMSPAMQPRETMARLLDLCAQRTGLHIEFRTEYERNL